MTTISIGFCGPPASGKSMLSRAVASALGWQRVAFGEYIRAEAQRLGRSQTRESLQELGASLVAQDAGALCNAVLAPVRSASGKSIVIDGIRHADVVLAMRDLLAPSQLRLVYVGLDEVTRRARLLSRRDLSELSLEQLDGHSTEVEVSNCLAQIAHLVVDGAVPIVELTDRIISWVQNQSENEYSSAMAFK